MTLPSWMPEFEPLPDRDAWATIRGFVYQVDVTLLRWLDLEGSEQLALECGEDVDRIIPALGRILEQIKYRERNITLRSPEALEAMVSFHTQRDLNPDVHVRFRFLSNASPGQEKPPTLAAATGIGLWSEVRTGDPSTKKTREGLQRIRAFLQAL